MWAEIFEKLIICLFKRDPCRNCLVQPCCRERCTDSIKFNRAIGGAPSLQRLSAWVLVLMIFVEIPWVIWTIIHKS